MIERSARIQITRHRPLVLFYSSSALVQYTTQTQTVHVEARRTRRRGSRVRAGSSLLLGDARTAFPPRSPCAALTLRNLSRPRNIRDGIDDHAMGNWRSGGPEWGMVRTYELGAAAPPGTALVCREPAVYCIAGERHGTAEPVTPVSVTDCHCVTQHLITAFDI